MNDLLRKLGLNKYEALAYESLLRNGAESAFSISGKSGVPFGRIYDSLKTLNILGLVEIVPGKPKKFKAVNPSIAVQNLVSEREVELEGIKKEIIEESKRMTKPGSEEIVSISNGKTAFARKLAEHLETAKNEIIATAEHYKLKNYYPAINRLRKKGAKETLLGPIKGYEKEVADLKKAGIKFKELVLPGVRFLVTDKELVTISIQDSEHEVVNISVKNKALGAALSKLLLR
jgi:sugar-specific transcriptional regulator TrmB